MATKTTVGIKFTKKAKTERTTLSSEEKLTGPEPEWTGEETGADFGQEYATKLRRAMFYCNHHYSLKDIKKDVLKYVDGLGAFDKEDMRRLGLAYDSKTGVSIFSASSMCRAGQRGAPLIEAHREYIVNTYKELLAKWVEVKAPAEKADGPVPYKPTIQDRLNEKLSEYIGHFEGVYDEVIMGGKKVIPGTFDYFKINEVPQMQINKLSNHFQKYIAELTEAQAGTDAQLKEGFSHLKAADFKRHLEFLNAIIEDCESYYRIKQTTRKPRAAKVPSKDKLVAKMKYLAEDKLLKVASIRPVDIIGATELWVYNSRTRKIGRYVADEYAKTLSVKGTTIVGFEESKSLQKTLRKPNEQIKQFMNLGKIHARKFLDTVKTTETLMNGRINADTLLLKVL